MAGYFLFDSGDSRNYSAWIFENDTFSAPKRNYNTQQVPGRNGSLLMDQKHYDNVSHVLDCIIYENAATNVTALRNWLLSKVGYKRLEDSNHPDEFYLAAYKSAITANMSPGQHIAKIKLTFDRKPQRFLKTGETMTAYTATGTITNPTLFPARPLLRVYGEGRVGIGDGSILITSANSYTDIDCEAMEAYKGTTSCNANIRVSGSSFPTLMPGSNGITLYSGISRVEVTPRWWRL